MNKWGTENRLSAIAMLGITTIMFFAFALSASATEKVLSKAKSEAEALSHAASESDSSAISDSMASNGDQVSLNTSQFYALSLTHPNAVDCFTGAQGGAAEDGTSGFLGLHLLNKSCWMDKLAGQERDIELNARLRCGDKHYRNAVAYDVPRKERQATCIRMKVESGQMQMQELKRDMDKLIEQQNRAAKQLETCHDRVDDANERTERCVESLTNDDK